jgi:predicted GNAT superfamily acetyltransferase/catechol 2,3-dioxygenase-like lactoylglutathione lyase family enzyme
MTGAGLRPPAAGDAAALLALNNAHAVELSELAADGLARLLAVAFRARVAGEGAALLVALDQEADYDSPNFLWFRARYPRFVYVDRVVVAPAARGRGLARALYADLFAAAAAAGHERIACEVNVEPPNPVSDAFHAALGFVEVGRAHLADRGKGVRYLLRELAPEPRLLAAAPQLVTADLPRSLAFFVERLGFAVAFAYGTPAFYAQVVRGGARLNLRHADRMPFDAAMCRRDSLLAATIAVASAADLARLAAAMQAAGVEFHQHPTPQPWGATDFVVIDPDGNLLHFAAPTDEPGA